MKRRHLWDADMALRHALATAVGSLPARERTVIRAILAGYTLHDIAGCLHVSPGRISRLKRRAIVRLRIALGAHHPFCGT